MWQQKHSLPAKQKKYPGDKIIWPYQAKERKENMINVSINKIRSAIAGCMTEIDVINSLRKHKIRYSFSTDYGFTQIRIPYKKGYIRIYRTCSRSAPFIVSVIPAVPFIAPVPVIYHAH